MKLLIVTEYFPPAVFGGGELSAYHLAKALARQGHEITVLTSKVSGEKETEEKDKIRILRRISTGKTPATLLDNFVRMAVFPRSLKQETVKLLAEESLDRPFDAVHCMNMTSMLLAELKEKINIPITSHLNSPLPICPKNDRVRYGRPCTVDCNVRYFTPCLLCSRYVGKVKNKWYLRFNPLFYAAIYLRYKRFKGTLPKLDGFMAISDFTRNEFRRFVNGMSRGIAVIPNIIPLDRFSLPHKTGKGKTGKTRILYYGALLETKGVPVLLDALDLLLREEYECSIYGNGPLADAVRASGNATLHASVPYDRLPKILSQHDIVVLPAVWPEPFGRVVIETMAAGLPIIASNTGGLAELVDDGKTGLLVPPNNAEALAEAMQKLIRDSKLREQMGKQAKAAAGKYDEARIAKTFIKEMKKMVQ